MSFNNEARKVRDAALPHGQRVQALGACVQMYRPIGFTATWAYLGTQVIGSWRRDPAVLVGYLDVIEASRSIRRERDAEFAASRRRDKARGNRSTGLSWHDTLARQALWHGDEAAGAEEALRAWRRLWLPTMPPGDPDLAIVVALLDATLECPAPHASAHRCEVRACVTRLRERERDPDAPTRTWELRMIAWHLTVAIDGPSADVNGPLP